MTGIVAQPLIGLHRGADRKAIDPRHHPVEQDDVCRVGPAAQVLKRLPAVDRRPDLVPIMATEQLLEQQQRDGIVIDGQDPDLLPAEMLNFHHRLPGLVRRGMAQPERNRPQIAPHRRCHRPQPRSTAPMLQSRPYSNDRRGEPTKRLQRPVGRAASQLFLHTAGTQQPLMPQPPIFLASLLSDSGIPSLVSAPAMASREILISTPLATSRITTLSVRLVISPWIPPLVTTL